MAWRSLVFMALDTSSLTCSGEFANGTSSKRPWIFAHSFFLSADAPTAYSSNDMCCMVTICRGSLRVEPDISASSCSRNRSLSSPPSVVKCSMFLPNSSIIIRTGAVFAMSVMMSIMPAALGILPFLMPYM